MSDIIFVRQIAEEIARIVETLRTTLSLKSTIIGEMSFNPTAGVGNLVNGVWIIPTPTTQIEPDSIPRILIQRYFYRVIFVRRINRNENVVKQHMADVATIINALTDKIHMPDITNLPATAQILQMLVRSVEWNPGEDNYVQQFGADLTAIAFNIEVEVRCRRG
jgi:hypothetical protein